MLEIADAHKAKILEGDSFRFFGNWKNPVIRELAPAMPGAKPLALAHACRPEITAAEVTETLNFLVKAGLLKKDKKGNYVQTEKSVTTGPMEMTPVAVRALQEIADCRKRIIAIARKNAATDEVYRLNMQLFPMTNKNVNKNS